MRRRMIPVSELTSVPTCVLGYDLREGAQFTR